MEQKKLISDVAIRHFLMTLLFLFIVGVLQSIGSFLVDTGIDQWYLQLKKPNWTPPNQVFGPVWFVLYIIIAFVGYIIWTRPKSKERTLAMFFWVVQLFFNGLWTYFFFGLKSTGLGLADIIVVAAFLILTMIYVYPISRLAFYLLIPYLGWLLYAGVINVAIFLMN